MNLVTALLQATAIMAALAALRPLLKRVLSPAARCALWALPTLRLLLPFQLRTPFSLMAPAQSAASGIAAAAAQPVEAPSWLGSGIGLEPTEALAPVLEGTAAAPSGPSLGSLLLLLWLVGALVTGGVILWQNCRFYAAVTRLSQPMGSFGGLHVFLVKGLPTPCLVGLFRPRICLNEAALSSDEVLEMTLLHELTHYRRRDHLWNGARGLVLTLYWFHPLVWLSSELFRQDCETACDQAATRRMDSTRRQAYGMALITLAARSAESGAGRLVCLSTMSSGKKLLKERITALAKARTFRCAAVLTLLLAAVLCLTMCTLPQEKRPAGEAEPVDTTNGEELPPAVSAQPLVPRKGEAGTLTDLAWYLELTAPGETFSPMGSAAMEQLLDVYGDLLEGYTLLGRVSAAGTAYVVGEYTGRLSDSPLYGMYSIEVYDQQGEDPTQLLYSGEDSALVEEALSRRQIPSVGWLMGNGSRITYSDASPLILIQAKTSATDLDVALSRYLYTPNGRAYIEDAVSRGIAMNTTPAPFLYVYRISEVFGEIAERIPLTQEQAQAILSQEREPIPQGFGFSASLHLEEETIYFSEHTGVPRLVLDMALEKCEYKFGSPGDITGPVTAATLECSWLTEPLHAAPEDLPRLEAILRGAEFGYVGACGYGAKLTLELTDGETVTVFKGTDGCGTLVFGSYGGYFISDKSNAQFWQIFGLDPETKEFLSK